MKKIIFTIFIILLGLVDSFANPKLKVATRNLEPFSFEEQNSRIGYTVELWEEICKNLNLDYEYVIYKTGNEIIEAVKKGEANVGVGALTVTSEREINVDFTHPFYESGLQVLIKDKGDNSFLFMDLIRKSLTWSNFLPFIILLLMIILISNALWYFERKINTEQWPKDYRAGLAESVWFTITTMLVGGTDNKGPVTFAARAITIIWMLSSIALTSFITATFTTAMTIDKLESKINGPEDIPGLKVATIQGSISIDWLKKKEATVSTYKDIKDCIKALRAQKVDAVVYDAPILQYEVSKLNDDKLKLVGPVFNRQYYGFPLEINNHLIEKINDQILKLNENGFCNKLKIKYFKNEFN